MSIEAENDINFFYICIVIFGVFNFAMCATIPAYFAYNEEKEMCHELKATQTIQVTREFYTPKQYTTVKTYHCERHI